MKHTNLELTVNLAALVAIAAFEGHAQESGRPAQTPEQRRIVISILNRKLTLLEGDRVLRISTCPALTSRLETEGHLVLISAWRFTKPLRFAPTR